VRVCKIIPVYLSYLVAQVLINTLKTCVTTPPGFGGPGVGKMYNEHEGKCMDEYVEKDTCLGPLTMYKYMIVLHFVSCNISTFSIYTDKKENQIFLIYKKMQSGAFAKSYMRKGFLIYEEMRKYFPICEEAVSKIDTSERCQAFRLNAFHPLKKLI
jgi:hypothetical protein